MVCVDVEKKTAKMKTFEIHVEILQLIDFSHKNITLFQINAKSDSDIGDMSFHIRDRIPLRNLVNTTRR